MKKHYSGNNSKKFWKLLNKTKPKLYVLGVTLQNLEEYILKELKNDKGRKKSRRGKRCNSSIK